MRHEPRGETKEMLKKKKKIIKEEEEEEGSVPERGVEK